jgi:hypothetical protein
MINPLKVSTSSSDRVVCEEAELASLVLSIPDIPPPPADG